MPRGAPAIYTPVKIPQSVHDAMVKEIERREKDPLHVAWTKSSFIIEAIQEKLTRIRDGRDGRKQRRQRARAQKGGTQAT